MEKEEKENIKLFGLVGESISYSFSKTYFTEKFKTLRLLDHRYVNFDMAQIVEFPKICKNHPNIKGLNVTIPYKEKVIPYLHHLSNEAIAIHAVNTIKIIKDKLIGYNTDYYGFMKSITPLLQPQHKKALILGTGGASKAIAYALRELHIAYHFVSRKKEPQRFHYTDLTKDIIEQHPVIINCTPLGTTPHTMTKPDIPYHYITPEHLLYDLVYNPSETMFLKSGKKQGAVVCNGLAMLQFQAEKAWEIWNR